MTAVSPAVKECIDACSDCHEVCVATVDHCLKMGGRHAEAGHVRLLLDCAEICETSANFMLRGSDAQMEVCSLCADIGEACAKSCDALGGPEMEKCAEACRRCAESCRRMSRA